MSRTQFAFPLLTASDEVVRVQALNPVVEESLQRHLLEVLVHRATVVADICNHQKNRSTPNTPLNETMPKRYRHCSPTTHHEHTSLTRAPKRDIHSSHTVPFPNPPYRKTSPQRRSCPRTKTNPTQEHLHCAHADSNRAHHTHAYTAYTAHTTLLPEQSERGALR